MNRKTIGALLVFVVLAGAVYYLQSRPERGERQGERPRPVARLKASQIKKVTVTVKGATVELARDVKKRWRVTKPVVDEADDHATRAMVDKLTKLEFGDMVTERKDRHGEHEVDDKGGIHVVVSDGNKTIADFRLGKIADGFTMLRVSGKDQVHQAVGTLTHAFKREVRNWRKRTIVEVKQQDVRQLEVTTAAVLHAGNIVLSRPDEKTDWKVVSSTPPTATLDKHIVSSLLSSLGNLNAFDFADDAKPEQTWLSTPTAKIVVLLKGGAKETVLLGKRKDDDYFVRREGDPQVYLLKKHAATNLLRRPIDFRDKGVLSLKADDVAALMIRKGKQSVTLTRRGDDWLGDGKKVKDIAKITSALDTLASLRGAGFAFETPEALGLDEPGWVVEIRLKDKTSHKLSVGTVEKDTMFGLSRQGAPGVYTFRKYTLDRFLLEPKDYK